MQKIMDERPSHQKAGQMVFAGNYNLFGLYDYQLSIRCFLSCFLEAVQAFLHVEQILNSML
jgi:hypothetical protein